MSQRCAFPALVSLGQEVIADVGSELLRGGRIVYMQLLASRFYEAVKAELAALPPDDIENYEALVAARDACDRLAQHNVAPHLLLLQLRATVAVLTGAHVSPPAARVPVRPTLRVIQGGRLS